MDSLRHRRDVVPAKLSRGLLWLFACWVLTVQGVLYGALLSGAFARPVSVPVVPASAPAAPLPPIVQPEGLAALEAALRADFAESETNVGVALVDGDGMRLIGVNADEPFELASVAKVYLMACYLDWLHERGLDFDDRDFELLQPMIRYSDNDSAQEVWEDIDGMEGLRAFLQARGMAPLVAADEEEWGTLEASPKQVADLLARLVTGRLLDERSTEIAGDLLSNIYSEQAWGIGSGLLDNDARVYLKNGWYPEHEGWRINTAGAVQSAGGTYALVIFAYPAETMKEGVSLVESVAARINAAMAP